MRAILRSIVVLAALLVPVTSAAGDKARRPMAVVVATGAKVQGVSRADLRRCFSGTIVYAGGIRLVPFNHPPTTKVRAAFDRTVLDMSPDEAGRFWIDRKIRGQSAAPRALPTSSYVNKVVAKFPGAISYLPADEVGAELKVLAIDGLLPGDAGYPLTVE